MIDAIESFLRWNFEHLKIEDAWNNLKDLSHSDDYTSPLWNAYRNFQFNLAPIYALQKPTANPELHGNEDAKCSFHRFQINCLKSLDVRYNVYYT